MKLLRILAAICAIGAFLYIGLYSIFSYSGRYQEVTKEGGVQYAVWFPKSFDYVSHPPNSSLRCIKTL
jgi:hypothetical protein